VERTHKKENVRKLRKEEKEENVNEGKTRKMMNDTVKE